MWKVNAALKRIAFLTSAAILILLGSLAEAQTRPNLFRQRPTWTTPSRHGLAAHTGDVDETVVSSGAAGITIAIPGQADLVVERQSHERRGARSSVWRGRGQRDRSAKMILTQHDGLLFGRIESGNEAFALRPGPNGRTVVEKLDPESFAPEWGHDTSSFGRDKIPPVAGSDTIQDGSLIPQPSTSADGTVQIDIMSVYTPQARAAAGGTAQIQGSIQAAVDQANTAFINSNMVSRFFLVHTAEVAYNDSGSIEADLNWLTSNSTVASWRNTHGADMVSLVTSNGGGYCGIGWVQRRPGASFANYAFQVTALNCLSNQTLAHEHGHNMGMEHDPASAGISSSGASYPWSFGHNVNGVFRTIMSYNVCSISCPRVLHFSNPDALYAGHSTGLADQRDNAHTGDLTAAIVANFRQSVHGGTTPNNPPAFTSDPIVKGNGTQGAAYSGSIASNATDADGNALTFSKTGGPSWLSVSWNGALSGTPGSINVGTNRFTVSVSDGQGGSDTAMLQITVVGTNTPPVFISDPIVKGNATQGAAYSGSLSSNAGDADGNTLTFSKAGGPSWLSVSSSGALSGTPGASNVGTNSFTVSVSDGRGGSNTATLQITVLAAQQMAAPSNLTATANGSKRIDLTWTDNSTSETGFRIERSGDNRKFSQIATVGAGVTTYSNTRLRRGKTFYYRVRANGSPTNSAYSNTASAKAN